MRNDKELLAASKGFSKEDKGKSWREVLVTIVLIASMFTILHVAQLPLLAGFAGSIVLGLLYVRLFVIYHDYQHRAILSESKLAEYLMTAVGVYLLAPPNIWKRSHEHHHNNNSKLSISGIGSYPLISKNRYITLTPKERLIYLVNRNPFTILFGYFTLFIYWLNVKSFVQSPSKHQDSLFALAFHFISATAIWYYFGFATFLIGWFTPFFLAFGMGSYLFYCQHNFPGAIFKENQDWSYVGAAKHSTSLMLMSPVMHWFTGYIGYHPVHHVNSRIPFYRLKEAMEAMPELHNAPTTSWHPKDIWGCLKLKLWDPEAGKMISLKELHHTSTSHISTKAEAMVA